MVQTCEPCVWDEYAPKNFLFFFLNEQKKQQTKNFITTNSSNCCVYKFFINKFITVFLLLKVPDIF